MCLKSAWYYSIDISYSILKNTFFFYASVWMTFIELCSSSPMIFSVMVKLLLELANEFVSNIIFFSSSIFIWFFSFSNFLKILHQFSSVPQLCPTLCNPMNHSTPGLPVHHQLTEFAQTQVHQVGDAIQPSHPLLSPSPPAPNPSQHQGLFQWVNSLHKVAKVLEFQLQHQSFQWIFRTDFL